MNTESDLVPDPVRPIYLQLSNPTKSQPQTNPRGAQGPDKYIGSRVQDSSCVGHHMGEHMIEYFGEPATEKKKTTLPNATHVQGPSGSGEFRVLSSVR